MVGGFKSDRQRRFVMAAIARGDIPYRRGISDASERLGARWTVEAQGLSVIVANNSSYAKLVQGEATQAAYHKITGWPTDEKVAQQEQGTIARMIEREVQRDIDAG
jgi:hypothetical protein